MLISSPDNARVKYLRRLSDNSSFREKEGKFLIEGPAALASLIQSGRAPLELYVREELAPDAGELIERAEKDGAKIIRLSGRCFKKISDVKTPRGLAGLYETPRYSEDDFFHNDKKLVLVCDEIADPGNLGTLIRTADAVAASGVIALGACASFFNPRTIRATASSILNVPVLSMSQEAFLERARNRKINLYVAAAHLGEPFHSMRWERPLGVVVGSEARGVSETIMAAGKPVSVPMSPGVESLNAAVAGSLLLYQAALGGSP